MSELKHTPGPWVVSYFTCDDPSQMPEQALAISPSAGFPGHGDAIAVVSPVSLVNERDEANARLIAAAPDLLSALQELLDAGDNCVTASDDVAAMLRFGDAVNDAHAAIAKATT